MNWLESWLLKRIIRKQVIQGTDHHVRITNLYRMIRLACEDEFTEDNTPTLNAFLKDCFDESLK
jgi:hypothetical protein